MMTKSKIGIFAKSVVALAIATSPFLVVAASASGPVVNVKSFGALGNGTTDDTTSINNAINSVQGSGGTVYFPPGNYIHTGQILATGGVSLLGSGNASMLTATGSNDALAIVFSGNGASIQKLQIGRQGSGKTGHGGNTGIWVLNATNFKINGCTITQSFQSPIFVNNGTHGVISSNRIIADEGMDLSPANDITITGNNISDPIGANFGSNGGVGIALGRFSFGNNFLRASNIRILSNTIHGYNFGIGADNVDNIDIESNTISGNTTTLNTYDAIQIDGEVDFQSFNLRIANNNIVDSLGGTIQRGNLTGTAIQFFVDRNPGSIRNAVISGNTITNASAEAVSLQGNSSNVVVDNNSISSIGGFGIWVEGGDTITLTNNRIDKTGEDGIECLDLQTQQPGTYIINNNRLSNVDLTGVGDTTLFPPQNDVIFVANTNGKPFTKLQIHQNTYSGSTNNLNFFVRAVPPAPPSDVFGNATNTMLPSKVGP